MIKHTHFKYQLIGIMYFFTTSCNENAPVTVYNPELVFPEAFEVKVLSYSYIDSISGRTFLVKGDSIADTLNGSPIFQWEKFSDGLYTVAISTEPIEVGSGTMINPESIVWQWHNSMKVEETFKNGVSSLTVAYNEGKKVFNKKISYDTQPLPLENGLYFWMVWGWDKTGKRVLYSSRQYSFFVE